MRPVTPHAGFTLIEMLVTLTIIGVMAGLVMPSFSKMIQNGRIASAAKSYALGIQTARAEAIRRNQNVEFVLTDTPIAAGIENSATPAAAGRNWVVRYQTPASGATYTPVEAKGTGAGETPPVQIAASGTAFTGIFLFNGLGAAASGAALSLDVSNPAGGDCAAVSGPMRCQRVQVRPGGQVRICDPAAAGTADTRTCQ